MKTVLKIGCGVLLGLGVLGIIGVVLIGQCLPPPPETVTPTPQPTPAPLPEKEKDKIIKDLTYIKAYGWMTYSDDADPEDEGIEIHLSWFDSKSEFIYFRNVPVSVTIEIFTTKFNLETGKSEPDKRVYKGELQIDSSGAEIRIPFETIKADPKIDRQYGIGKVVIHTPQQGNFSDEIVMVKLYESD